MSLACKKNQISKYLLAGLIESAYKLHKADLKHKIKVLLIALIVWIVAGPIIKPLIINAYIAYCEKNSMVIGESDTKTPLFNAEILHQNATYSLNLNQIKESFVEETHQTKESLEPVQLTNTSKQKVVVKTQKTNDVTEKATNIQPEPTKKATKAFEPIYPMVDK